MQIEITDNGSTWSFRPLDDEAREFLHSIGADNWQFLGDTMVVDHRLAPRLVEQFADDGVEFVG
jgi:hypothetical protein